MHNKLLQQTLDTVVAISLCPRVALAFSISLLFSLDAFGCSCRLGELTEIEIQASLCKSDQIFIAKALSTTALPENRTEHALVVERTIKGSVPGLARSVPGQSTMCHMQFKKGERYIVFAVERDDGRRFASSKCGPSQRSPSTEFVEKIEALVSNADSVCSQDFSRIRRERENEKFELLLEETKRAITSDDDET